MVKHIVIVHSRMLVNGCIHEAEQRTSGVSHDGPCALHNDMAGAGVFLGSLPLRIESLVPGTRSPCPRVLRRLVTTAVPLVLFRGCSQDHLKVAYEGYYVTSALGTNTSVGESTARSRFNPY